jgi:hypothetical protein
MAEPVAATNAREARKTREVIGDPPSCLLVTMFFSTNRA